MDKIIKQRLNDIYREYDKGQMSKQQFKDIVNNDLQLKTNNYFDKAINKV